MWGYNNEHKPNQSLLKGLRPTYKLSWQDKSFIKSFPRNIKLLQGEELTLAETNFLSIFNQEVSAIKDPQSQSFLIMCAYLAAMYEGLLAKGLSQKECLPILSKALIKSAGGKYVKWFTRFYLWIKRDKRKFVENSSIKTKGLYGSFLQLHEEYGDNSFTSVVSKCGIHELFKQRDQEELTACFCQWDNLWADEINRQNCGIKFSRPQTIAEGKESCRFEFQYLDK